MTEETVEQAGAGVPAAPRDWIGLATLGCAALSSLLSLAGLMVALGSTPPSLAAAAHAAIPSPSEAPAPADASRVLVAIELLLPHLPRAAPFPRSFATAVALTADDAEVTRLVLPLAAAAAEGAPTLRQIAEEFGPVGDAVVLAEMGFGQDAGWLARQAEATMRLGAGIGAAGTVGLVVIRDAAARLAEGDAPGAAARLAVLPAGSVAALDAWRLRLGRRIAADAARVQLAGLALARAQAAPR